MGILTAENRHDTVVAWAFVAVQVALLVVLALAPADDVWIASPAVASAARFLQWIGMAVLVVGLVSLGRSLTPLPSPIEHGVLTTGGMYRVVRHPIYSGILALAAGMVVLSGSVVVAAAAAGLTVLFMAKARWEEARLRERYDGYADYASRTPRFVPGWPFGADRDVAGERGGDRPYHPDHP